MPRACTFRSPSAIGTAARATGSAPRDVARRAALALLPARASLARHAARPLAAHANPKDAAAVAGDTLASCIPARTPDQQDRLVEEAISFLKEDLQHLFDDQGIDASKYEPDVVFEDPITYYNGIQGYLFNIAFLRRVFSPAFVLHDVRRTGPLEVTTRWTMRMRLAVARGTPLRRFWDPRLTFTGTSIMGINPDTGRFNRHVDTWDAVQRQRYFSLEAFLHMLQQVGDLRQGPQDPGQYEVLLKRRGYEVRQYTQLPRSAARSAGAEEEGHTVWAVADFAGTPDDKAAESVRSQLERELSEAGLHPASRTWLLAAGGGPSAQGSPSRWRSEVLVPIQGFQLWQ